MEGTQRRTAKKDGQRRVESNSGQDGKGATEPAGPGAGKADGESAVLAVIAKMPEPYRTMGGRLHTVIRAAASSLTPRLWYGMPAYAKDGKVICFFRGGDKFEERYMTLGFNQEANLDEGHMWPVAYALTELTGAEERRIAELVKRAVS